MGDESKTVSPGVEAIGYFQQHLVPMAFSFDAPNTRPIIVSAFLLSVKDAWFFVTAGHCLRDVEENIKKGFPIKNCLLLDFGALEARHPHPVPFPYDPDAVAILDKDVEYGHDYGVIPVPDFYKRTLKANNIRPLNEDVWKSQPDRIDFYMLLGVPEELVTHGNEVSSVRTKMLDIEKLDSCPPDLKDSDVPRFYGKINLSKEMSSIVGMSGGPIFAFKVTDGVHMKYWLHALQSTWNQGTRHISACYTTGLAQAIEDIMSGKYDETDN